MILRTRPHGVFANSVHALISVFDLHHASWMTSDLSFLAAIVAIPAVEKQLLKHASLIFVVSISYHAQGEPARHNSRELVPSLAAQASPMAYPITLDSEYVERLSCRVLFMDWG
jgi:hypothetical protein